MASSDKFNLEAKSDAKFNEQMAALSVDQGKEEKRQMLRGLLADRFKLTAHIEKREMPIFALLIAKGGTKLAKTNASGGAIGRTRSDKYQRSRYGPRHPGV